MAEIKPILNAKEEPVKTYARQIREFYNARGRSYRAADILKGTPYESATGMEGILDVTMGVWMSMELYTKQLKERQSK